MYIIFSHVFRLLLEGAPLIAIHKARYFKRKDGLYLGPGKHRDDLHLSGAESRISQDYSVNTMAANALAPCVARLSATMVSIMQIKQVLVFHEEGFQHVASFQCGEMINPLCAKFCRENINIYLHFMSLLHIDMSQVFKILHQIRPGPTYST